MTDHREPLEKFMRRRSRARAPKTIPRYLTIWRTFRGWAGKRPLDQETVDAYSMYLKTEKKNAKNEAGCADNTVIVYAAAVNLGLEWCGSPARMKPPPKGVNPGGRLVSPEEFGKLVKHFEDRENVQAVLYLHLQRDTGWRPSDLMSLEVSQVELKLGILLKVTEKARVLAKPVLAPETVTLLRDWLDAMKPAKYVFEQRDGRSYHRTWPNQILREACAELGLQGITPKVFRRTLATNWDENAIKELQIQAGWKDVKTIFTHYRQAVDSRQRAAAYKALGVKSDEEDVPGYG